MKPESKGVVQKCWKMMFTAVLRIVSEEEVEGDCKSGEQRLKTFCF